MIAAEIADKSQASLASKAEAAKILQEILHALEPTGSKQDTRLRKQIARAAKSLQQG
jgi:hypothetical protein